MHTEKSTATPCFLLSFENIFYLSSVYCKISAGWHCSSLHIAFNVEKRIADILPVLIFERFASVSSIFEAKSFNFTPFSFMTLSKFKMIIASHRPFAAIHFRN